MFSSYTMNIIPFATIPVRFLNNARLTVPILRHDMICSNIPQNAFTTISTFPIPAIAHATVQETLNEPAAPKQYSKGRAHSALIRAALAARQVQKAQQVMQLKTNQSQNIAKAVFSSWARGKNSSNHSHQFLASVPLVRPFALPL